MEPTRSLLQELWNPYGWPDRKPPRIRRHRNWMLALVVVVILFFWIGAIVGFLNAIL